MPIKHAVENQRGHGLPNGERNRHVAEPGKVFIAPVEIFDLFASVFCVSHFHLFLATHVEQDGNAGFFCRGPKGIKAPMAWAVVCWAHGGHNEAFAAELECLFSNG